VHKNIPQHFINLLLDKIDLVDLIGSFTELKRQGESYSGLCPFHNEKTPSFVVTPRKSFYYCFGCRAHGNAISFMMDYHKYNFVQAVETLADSINLPVPVSNINLSQHKLNYAMQNSITGLLSDVAIFYQTQLRRNYNNSIEYLKSRGITGIIAKTFALGYADNSNQSLVQKFGSQQCVTDSGLVYTKSNRIEDRFNNRVMFPIRTIDGQVIAFGGRKIENNSERPKYLNSAQSPVFNKSHHLYGIYEAYQASRTWQDMLVVEGYMDVISLYKHGLHNSVATLGTAVSHHHLLKLFKLVSKVTFCFDGDNAGMNAAKRAMQVALPLVNAKRHAYFLLLPQSEDPDSLINKLSLKGFKEYLSKALTLPEFILESCAIKPDSIENKAFLAEFIAEQLGKMQQSSYKELLYEYFDEKVGVKISTTNTKTVRANNYKTIDINESKKNIQPISFVISAIINFPELAQSISDSQVELLANVETDALKSTLLEVLDFIYNQNDINTGKIIAAFTHSNEFENLKKIFSKNLVSGFDKNKIQAQLNDYFIWLSNRKLKNRIECLSHKPITTLTEAEKQELKSLYNVK
jgi:DNA primase